MKNEETEKKIKVFRKFIEIMKSNDGFPEDEKNFVKTVYLKFMRLFMIVGSFLVIGLLGFLIVVTKDELRLEQIDCSVLLVQLSVLMFTLFFLFKNAQHWINLLEKLSDYTYGKPADWEKINRRIDLLMTCLYYAGKVIVVTYHTIQYINNSYCEGKNIRGDDKYICGASYTLWYPVELQGFMRIVLIVSICILISKYVAAFVLMISFAGSSFYLVVLRVIHLREKITDISAIEDPNPYIIQQKLYTCIKYHSQIIEMGEDMTKAVGYTGLPISGLLPILIALFSYQALQNTNLLALALGMPYLIGISLLCSIGQYLEDESSLLANSVYNVKWYEMTPKMRKKFHLFHGRVQKPLFVQVKPFAQLNSIFLLQVMKKIYSLLMFLVQMSSRW